MANVLKQIFVSGSDQISQTYTIESWHVSQSVDAITGTAAYDITLSGSFTLTGSQYVTGSISASFGSNTVGFFGTSSWAVSSSRAISSSFATSASYALSSSNAISASISNTAVSSNTVTGYYIPSGSIVAAAGVLKIFAGAGKTNSSVPPTAIVTVSPVDLTGKTLNQNLFLGVAPSQSATINATLNSPTSITFESDLPNIDFTFIATYI
jgi:hypothetical protein